MSTDITHDLEKNGRDISSEYAGEKNKKSLNSFCLLLIITVCFFIISTGFTVVTRAGIQAKMKKDLSSNTNQSIPFMEDMPGETSRRILNNLLYTVSLLEQAGVIMKEGTDFYDLTIEYFNNPSIPMTMTKAEQMEEKIKALQDIITYEGDPDDKRMSIDGKRIAIYISKQIFKICGLKPEFNMEGHIKGISDIKGIEIYKAELPVRSGGIHIIALVTTVFFLIILLALCIIVARRNRLFVKGVIHDGFDEEGFA